MRAASRLLIVLTVAMAAVPAWSQEKAQMSEPAVFRYVGTREHRWMGRKVLKLQVAPAAGGATQEMVIPNRNPMGHDLDPPKFITDILNGMQRGGLLEIRYSASTAGSVMVNRLSAYTAKPGEEEPGVFVFERLTQKKVGRREQQTVVLSKFLKQTTVRIPMKRDENGKMVPDGELLKVAQGFKAGDSVEVAMQKRGGKAVLRSIRRYEPPQQGEFVKMTETEVGQDKRQAVEVDVEGETQVLVVRGKTVPGGKFVPDAALMKQVKALKAGQEILFKVTKDDTATWLRQVRLVSATQRRPRRR